MSFNFIEFQGKSKDSDKPINVFFQTEKTLKLYDSGEIDENFGLTLEGDESDEMFWFDTQEDKEKWIEQNLKFVKK
jgi:hypothetical protein